MGVLSISNAGQKLASHSVSAIQIVGKITGPQVVAIVRMITTDITSSKREKAKMGASADFEICLTALTIVFGRLLLDVDSSNENAFSLRVGAFANSCSE